MNEQTSKDYLTDYMAALEAKDVVNMKRISQHLEPLDIANELSIREDLIASFCNLSQDEKIASVLVQADEKTQAFIIRCLDDYRMLYIFNYMPKDDIVDILGDLPVVRRKQLINLMQEGDKKVIQELLGYLPDSAGGIMTTEYIALHGSMTVKNAMEKIKEIAPRTEVIETIFVVDCKHCLTGLADLRDILISDENVLLDDIADKNYISCTPETDQENVSLLVAQYDLKVIPVINKQKSLLGIITVDDIIDVIEEEHAEDMYGLAGVGKEERLDTSISQSIKMRLPWLLINMLTAFLASFTVKMFESTIEQVVALSATMTIVSGMGGNAGTQTLSIIVRSLAIGDFKNKSKRRLLLKEMLLGIVNGAVIGIITGGVVWLVYGNIWLVLIIFLSMIANMVIAGFFGFLIPIILKKCHADPALASSIFLTTATDVLGFFVFLGMAKLLLPHLL